MQGDQTQVGLRRRCSILVTGGPQNAYRALVALHSGTQVLGADAQADECSALENQ